MSLNGAQPSQPMQIPPVDPGNPLLAEGPAMCCTAEVDTPAGKRLAFTIRTPSTTLTVLLQRADAHTWASQIENAARGMSGLITPTVIPPTDLTHRP